MRRVRPPVTVVVVVALLLVGGVWWLFFRDERSDEECAPVRELLSYNKTQVDALNAKTHIPEEGSFEGATEPSDLEYRAWADGISDRAAKVTAQGLSDQSNELSKTVQRLVQARIDFNRERDASAPGAPAPQALAMLVTSFNDQYEAQVSQLAKQCPA